MKFSESMHPFCSWFGRLLAAAVCLLTAVSHSEESAKIGLRALLLAPSGSTVTLRTIFDGKASEPLTIGSRGLTESFAAPSRQFSLALPDQKAENGFRPVGDVVLPDQAGDFILLLEPTAEKFNVHVLANRDSRFVGGSKLFFNASEVPVMAILGSEKTLIKPRVPIFAKAPSRGENPYYEAGLYQSVDGKMRLFFNSNWAHSDDFRCYVFIYRNKAGRLTHQATDEPLRSAAPAQGQQAQ